MVAPKDFFRRADTDAKVYTRLDGRVQVLYHSLGLRILLLSFFFRLSRLRCSLAAQQIRELFGTQRLALLAGVDLRLRQQLRQLRPEFAAIVHALGREIFPLAPN